MQTFSWGNYPQRPQKITSFPDPSASPPVLPYGMGRSYGDSCLNSLGSLLSLRNRRYIRSFDPVTGVLRVEAGALLSEVLAAIVPRGWFLPVVPGTKWITVGGAVANDIHGKNHGLAGTFGRHIHSLSLWRTDGEIRHCSLTENADLFAATIGGLGLTGLVTEVTLQLEKIESSFLEVHHLPFRSWQEYTDLETEWGAKSRFTVSWVDSFMTDGQGVCGIFMAGDWATSGGELTLHQDPMIRVPFPFPSWALSAWKLKILNQLYFMKNKNLHESVHYDPYFFPLDKIQNWNLVYGRRGFLQYQCVVPDVEGVQAIFAKMKAARLPSYLVVLKKFGEQPSPGLLSFPRPGFTVALDFPHKGQQTLDLLDQLDIHVQQEGGRVYPAKDARMKREYFKAFYPQIEEFLAWRDPGIESDFFRRVMQ